MITITLLTKQDCALCDHAKRVLADVASDIELVVEEAALDTPEGEALARDAGFAFAPGVLIDGEPFSFGRLSERKLRRALSQRVSSI